MISYNGTHSYDIYDNGYFSVRLGEVIDQAEKALTDNEVAGEEISAAERENGRTLETLDDLDYEHFADHLTVCMDTEAFKSFLADYGADDIDDDHADLVADDLGGYPLVIADSSRLDAALKALYAID